jgi:hypothetical protein
MSNPNSDSPNPPNPKLFILLEEAKPYMTDGDRLLGHVLDRYSLELSHHYFIQYCYSEKPPSKQVDRLTLKEHRRNQLLDTFRISPVDLSLVVMGKLSCEMVFTKAKYPNRPGTAWKLDPFFNTDKIIKQRAWVTYNPAAALFDPNLIVDISAVIFNAAQEANLPIKTNKHIKQFNGWKL